MSTAKVNKSETVEELRNEDPITGEPGCHAVGAGLGTAAGGAVAGAAAGAAAGPIGAAAGASVGGVAGGLAGKAVAEELDPTVETQYWRENYEDCDYVPADAQYATYEPAYRYGWESRTRYDHSDFAKVEPELREGWTAYRADSKMDWDTARPAAQDAWNRAHQSCCKKPK